MGEGEVEVNTNNRTYWKGYYDGYDGCDPDAKYPPNSVATDIEAVTYWDGYSDGAFDALTAATKRAPAQC